MTTEQAAALVEAARLAPSPDNNQPWAFSALPGGLAVWHVRERAIPSDVDDLFSFLAVGAAIENVRIAAGDLGLSAGIRYEDRPFPSESGRERVAVISLSPAAPKGLSVADPLSLQVGKRHTNRKPYRTAAPPPETLAAILAAAAVPGVQLDFAIDRKAMDEVGRSVARFDRARFEYEPFHRELFHCLRFTPAEAESSRDGLDLRCLEMPSAAVPFLRSLGSFPRMRSFNRVGGSRALALMSLVAIRKSGALALLSAEAPGDRAFLEGGRAMERFWLAAAGQGLAVQPLGSVPLFLLAAARGRLPAALPPAAVARARRALEAAFHHGGRTPLLLFRIGVPSGPPTARSLRYEAGRLRAD